MQFRVKARTILQLGAELISSDGIAFYELIKNGFDAGSPRVVIDITFRVPVSTVDRLRSLAANGREDQLSSLCKQLLQAVLPGSDPKKELEEKFGDLRSLDAFITALDWVNVIQVSDTGHGMDPDHLRGVYLEVGTPFRLLQRQDKRKNPLGEKGLGRLATMRLGWKLTVKSTTTSDAYWHQLRIDWSAFDRDPDAYVEDIEVPKLKALPKEEPKAHGTSLRIGRLTRDWTISDARLIAEQEFSRLTDPFTPAARYPVTLRFNGATLLVPSFDSTIFTLAHATVTASYATLPAPRLTGIISFQLHDRECPVELGEAELMSITGASPVTLRRLGPFTVTFYWYNRMLLKAVEGIGDRKRVQEIVRDWANGLMVFRDGFRVNPYGSPHDDWLDLDKRAFGSAGYKVNRHQIIGKVDITSRGNPYLVDQTNREGLRTSEEFLIAVKLLQHLVWNEFKVFLQAVEKDLAPTVTLDEIAPQVRGHRQEIRGAVKELCKRHPSIKKDTDILEEIDQALKKIASVMREAQKLANLYENRRNELLHLAGLGLMVEILAHELSRATQHALGLVGQVKAAGLPTETATVLSTLSSQLKTLNTRLRVLDPLATSGRQRKENFELVQVVKDVVASRDGQFRRHRIDCAVVDPRGREPGKWHVEMVKGMLIQVLENLLTNSIYWLKQAQLMDGNHEGTITISIDPKARTVSISDNGPGILPSLAERVFEPFFTTKPPGRGKGLGLYISREIAHYHRGTLELSPVPTVHKQRLNTFVLTLPES